MKKWGHWGQTDFILNGRKRFVWTSSKFPIHICNTLKNGDCPHFPIPSNYNSSNNDLPNKVKILENLGCGLSVERIEHRVR